MHGLSAGERLKEKQQPTEYAAHKLRVNDAGEYRKYQR
jgi:hypothetical protein